jgi:uncharacterized protein
VKKVLRVLRGALFVAVVYWAAMAALQRYLLFPRWVVPHDPAPATSAQRERWTLKTEEGETEAWLLVSDAERAPALVFFHGNGERTDDWLKRFEVFRARGFHVLLVEYRGYNRSSGTPSREHLVADSTALVQRLKADPRVDPERVSFLGRSLGGAVAVEVAQAVRPHRLVLQSTFTSVTAMALRRGLPPFLIRDPFDSLERLKRLGVPLLVAHGRADSVIPYAHGEALAQAGQGDFLSYDCGHNDFPPSWSDWVEEVFRFVERPVEVRP